MKSSTPATTAPAFVVGCRRSGTTLVSRIIDAHSAFSIYHETFFYPIFSKELRWYGDLLAPANLNRLIDDVRDVLSTQIALAHSVKMPHDAPSGFGRAHTWVSPASQKAPAS